VQSDGELAARIAALIESHRAGVDCSDWQREVAIRYGALGVYGDIGGALMVRPDGSVLGAGWDDDQATAATEGWRIIGLAAASYWFPDLAALTPERPTNARICWKCGGPGCRHCFNMGWLPDINLS
jgi:hypothetical protein